MQAIPPVIVHLVPQPTEEWLPKIERWVAEVAPGGHPHHYLPRDVRSPSQSASTEAKFGIPEETSNQLLSLAVKTDLVLLYDRSDLSQVLIPLSLVGTPLAMVDLSQPDVRAIAEGSLAIKVEVGHRSDASPPAWVTDALEIARALGAPVTLTHTLESADCLLATSGETDPDRSWTVPTALVPLLKGPSAGISRVIEFWKGGYSRTGDAYDLADQLHEYWSRIEFPSRNRHGGPLPSTPRITPSGAKTRRHLNPFVSDFLRGHIEIFLDRLAGAIRHPASVEVVEEACVMLARLAAQPREDYRFPDSRLLIGPLTLRFAIVRLTNIALNLRSGRLDQANKEIVLIRALFNKVRPCPIAPTSIRAASEEAVSDKDRSLPHESRFCSEQDFRNRLGGLARHLVETIPTERTLFFQQIEAGRGARDQAKRIACAAEFCAGRYPGDLVEIGAHIGLTTVRLGQIARQYGRRVIVVDPWEIGGSGDCGATFDAFQANTREVADALDIARSSSQAETVKELLRGRELCFAYVDGLHTYDACLSDILAVGHTLGLIVVDDLLSIDELVAAFDLGATSLGRLALHFPLFREGYLMRPDWGSEREVSPPAFSSMHSANFEIEGVMA